MIRNVMGIVVLTAAMIGCTAAKPEPARLAAKVDQVPKGVTAVVVTNESGEVKTDIPVTFALPFVAGDVPADQTLVAKLADGTVLPTQVDRKAVNADGSLRHGIITIVLPKLGDGDKRTVVLALGKQPRHAKPASVADLPPDFDATVNVSLDGKQYSASARDLLQAGHVKTWLAGPLVSEWIVRGPLKSRSGDDNRHLAVQFAIRYYRGANAVRVSTVVENDWTYIPDPRALAYDVDLRVGGRQVYAKQHLIQYAQTRWRKVCWWGRKPSTYVQFNLAYLKATYTIPNYDPDLRIPERRLAKIAKRLARSNTEPGGVAFVHKAMPSAGGRGDIGPLPRWTVLYLASMDRRAWQATRTIADLSGSWPIHYRDRETDLPLSLAKHPRASAHYLLKGDHDYSIPKIQKRPKGIPRTDLKPNTAHEPSLAFVPYRPRSSAGPSWNWASRRRTVTRPGASPDTC